MEKDAAKRKEKEREEGETKKRKTRQSGSSVIRVTEFREPDGASPTSLFREVRAFRLDIPSGLGVNYARDRVARESYDNVSLDRRRYTYMTDASS